MRSGLFMRIEEAFEWAQLFFTALFSFFTARLLGAAVELEHQWRQRMAGTRTNALVAAGEDRKPAPPQAGRHPHHHRPLPRQRRQLTPLSSPSGSFQEQRSRHAPHDQHHPQRKRQSGPRKRRASGRSVAQSLDGRWSGGYPATDAQPCIFNTFTHSNP